MAKHSPGEADRSTLAAEAGPVRLWLMRYFRRRIQDYAEIEDMVQDVFTRMVARDAATPIDHLGGYVMKTASSVLADRARLRATHGAGLHVTLDAEVHGEDEIDPARILGARQDLHAATAALLGLPERTRNVFIL